jgi:hypothetical protein
MFPWWLKTFAFTKQQAPKGSRRLQLESLESRRLLSQFFEAENARLGGVGPYFDGTTTNDYPRIEDVRTSGQTGYDGSGYANLAYSDDSTITWDNVSEEQAGDYTLSFRYSMDTYYTDLFVPDRPMGLAVNENIVTRALPFHATGDSTTGVDPWSIWKDLPVTVHLNAGANTIELFATNVASSGANPHVDSLTITPVAEGVTPPVPTGLTVSAGVGDVDLRWDLSPFASSYNVYRSTTSGSEALLATGVAANYFFDTRLASDGTSYFYQVSAVNSGSESPQTNEASATPSSPAGLLFSDDFSNGASPAWNFTPGTGYWSPQIGQLTDSAGDTVAGVAQTATVVLPAGTVSWQADMLTKENHGAAVDSLGNPGISGISVQSADGLDSVVLGLFGDYTINVGTTVDGVWKGWTQIGTVSPVAHPAGVEPLWHTYEIRLDADATFSVLSDGTMLRSGIDAGLASGWGGGIGMGSLFTMSNLDDRHLSTRFDRVRALGLVPDAPDAARASIHGDSAVLGTGNEPAANVELMLAWRPDERLFTGRTLTDVAGISRPANSQSLGDQFVYGRHGQFNCSRRWAVRDQDWPIGRITGRKSMAAAHQIWIKWDNIEKSAPPELFLNEAQQGPSARPPQSRIEE